MALAEPIQPEPPFRREGLGWRFDPPGAPVVLRFSRLADHREETTAEVHVARRDGEHIFRRRVNLLGSRTQADLVKELRERAEGLDVDWASVVASGCESVLDAHRSGVDVETVEGEIDRPAPVRHLVKDLLIAGKANCWVASAKTGKSTLAKLLCLCHASGVPFLGRETARGVPLYLDWEDDRETYDETLYLAARGLGMPTRLPRTHYIRMAGKRLRDQVEALSRIIIERGVTLIVIDAIAAAGGPPGDHTSYETIALELEHTIGMLPPVTVLGLDHGTGEEVKSGGVPLKGRGSIRKLEFFRNQWSLVRDQEASERGQHVVGWTHTAINRGAFQPRFAVELIHREDEVVARAVGLAEARSMWPTMRKIDRCIAVIRNSPGLNVRDIAEGLAEEKAPTNSDVESVRITLKRERDRGTEARVYTDNEGHWWPVDRAAEPPLAAPLRIVRDARNGQDDGEEW